MPHNIDACTIFSFNLIFEISCKNKKSLKHYIIKNYDNAIKYSSFTHKETVEFCNNIFYIKQQIQSNYKVDQIHRETLHRRKKHYIGEKHNYNAGNSSNSTELVIQNNITIY